MTAMTTTRPSRRATGRHHLRVVRVDVPIPAARITDPTLDVAAYNRALAVYAATAVPVGM